MHTIIKKVLICCLSLSTFISCQKNKGQQEYSGGTKLTAISAQTNSNEYEQLKAELAAEGVNIDNVTLRFYYNGQQSDINNHINNMENIWPVYSSTKNPDDQSAVITIHTFSSEANHDQFLHNNNVPLNFVQFKSQVHAEALNRGYPLDTEVQTIDPNFRTWLDNQYDLSMPSTLATFGANFLHIWDDIVPYGTNTYLPASNPSFWIYGWNNRVGCYENAPIGVGYHMNIFWDKSFFRRHLGTFWRWSFTKVSFSSFFGTAHLNNKVSSNLSF